MAKLDRIPGSYKQRTQYGRDGLTVVQYHRSGPYVNNKTQRPWSPYKWEGFNRPSAPYFMPDGKPHPTWESPWQGQASISRVWKICEELATTRLANALNAKITNDKGELLMTLAQADKTAETFRRVIHGFSLIRNYPRMMRNRRALNKALRWLKRNGYARAVQASEVITKENNRRQRRHLGYFLGHGSSTWLEFQWGILPLIADLKNVTAVLRGKRHPSKEIAVSAKFKIPTFANPEPIISQYRKRIVRYDTKITGYCYAKATAQIEITNPKLRMLEEVGLLNPFLALNDVIPHTYFANYFLNHEAWLASLTAQAGLTVKIRKVIHCEYEAITDCTVSGPNDQIMYGSPRVSGSCYIGERYPEVQGIHPTLRGTLYFGGKGLHSLKRKVNMAAVIGGHIFPALAKYDPMFNTRVDKTTLQQKWRYVNRFGVPTRMEEKPPRRFGNKRTPKVAHFSF